MKKKVCGPNFLFPPSCDTSQAGLPPDHTRFALVKAAEDLHVAGFHGQFSGLTKSVLSLEYKSSMRVWYLDWGGGGGSTLL